MNVVNCPSCGGEILDDGAYAGQTVACPRCGNELVMPNTAAVQPLTAPAPAANKTSVYLYQAPKNSGLAAVLSFFYVGVGQVYNGQIGKGLLMIFLPIPVAIFVLATHFGVGVAMSGNEEEIIQPRITINGVRYSTDQIPAEHLARLTPSQKRTVLSQQQDYEARHRNAATRRAAKGAAWLSGLTFLTFALPLMIIGVWIFGIFDAYTVAERINARHAAKHGY